MPKETYDKRTRFYKEMIDFMIKVIAELDTVELLRFSNALNRRISKIQSTCEICKIKKDCSEKSINENVTIYMCNDCYEKITKTEVKNNG